MLIASTHLILLFAFRPRRKKRLKRERILKVNRRKKIVKTKWVMRKRIMTLRVRKNLSNPVSNSFNLFQIRLRSNADYILMSRT